MGFNMLTMTGLLMFLKNFFQGFIAGQKFLAELRTASSYARTPSNFDIGHCQDARNYR
jgi:hypothetical protein